MYLSDKYGWVFGVCHPGGWLGDEDVRAHLAVVDHGAEAVQRVAEPL